MDQVTTGGRYCIIGAGASGLAAAKNFKQRGIPFDCLEREQDLGGLWNFVTPSGRVYTSTHTVSSREFTCFDGWPMPEDYPVYPSHEQCLAYLRSYAEEFDLIEHIVFGANIQRVEHDGTAWQVHVAGEPGPRSYAGIVVANGHHDAPRRPDYPGAFAGEIIHSRDYKSPAQIEGKRVLVVGAGNSGCDIVIDAVHHAQSVTHSLRRGTYFIPKFTFGLPTDDVVEFIERARLPRWFRQILYGLSHRVLAGPEAWYGLPKPEHGILDTHPTLNAEVPSRVAHGRIDVRPNVASFAGRTVTFTDGSTAEIDLIVYATGYDISFPFLDEDLLLDADGVPNLFLNTFHPDRDDIFTVGLIQANGSIWQLADYQSQLIACYLVALSRGSERARWFRGVKAEPEARSGRSAAYVQSARHKLEADFYVYSRKIHRLIRKFKGEAKLAYAGPSDTGRAAATEDPAPGEGAEASRAA